MNSKKIGDEYFDYYLKYQKEYGENICIFMQIGSFYEMQMVKNENENIGNIDEIARILNIQVTKRNKSIDKVDRSNPYMAGFPKIAISKFLPILLDNGYTVILIDQDQKVNNKVINRTVSGIYSPSIRPLEYNITTDDNNLASIFVELYPNGISYSFLNINMTTNTFDIYEQNIELNEIDKLRGLIQTMLDDIYRIKIRYNLKELIINIISEIEIPENLTDTILNKEYLYQYFDLSNGVVHWSCINKLDKSEEYKEYTQCKKINFQNEFLKRVYKHVNFGLLEPIESFDLEFYQTSIMNIIYSINFISRHDQKYIEGLAIPKITNEFSHLILEMNTLQQLNIIPDKSNHKFGSLFNVINKTQTAIGKRGLKNLLCKPYKDYDTINQKYLLSKSVEDFMSRDKNKLEKILGEISDFERLHRKLTLKVLHPHEFHSLHLTYDKLIELDNYLKSSDNESIIKNCIKDEIQIKLDEYRNEYSKIFNLQEIKKYNINETIFTVGNFFNEGIDDSLDCINIKIETVEKSVEAMRKEYENMIKKKEDNTEWIKTCYSESDGYYFTCSKIRTELLKKATEQKKDAQDSLVIKTNMSICKISNGNLRELSLKLINHREILLDKIKKKYIDTLQIFADKYNDIFNYLKSFVEIFDIISSNIKCKRIYNYTYPEIIDEEDSFFEAKSLRHPIIERINEKTEYVPNDISLSDSNGIGMILYALNSCGKSSLLRSIGLSVVMAQCGLCVPCDNLRYSPFSTIITQVDLYDNMWKSQSSFLTEMVGLRKIMKLADDKCLVLSDELTKGTEVISATSLFATSALELVKKKTKFVFTTHLQDVSKLEEVQQSKGIQICHLSVIIENNNITFERKLKPGPCSELYGLEVAKAVGLDSIFMEKAFEIRNKLINKKKEILKTKGSRYNKKKKVDMCEICKYTPIKKTDLQLDTHHIKEQHTADENNFIGHIHKNSKFNLVILCKHCHQEVHKGNIDIDGYQETTNGTQLVYKINKIIEI